MHTFTATSYSMGRAVQQVTFKAHSPEAAVTNPALRSLGAHGLVEDGRKGRIIGIKRHDKTTR